MKYIIIVPDGMADVPLESLNNRTPLEAARRTNMDYLAQHGITGRVQTIPAGMHPGSDIGNMAILGYSPEKYHTGRAPLEAANQNILLQDDEIAFRCNLVTVVDDKMSDYSAGHITTKEAEQLVESLNNEIDDNGMHFYVGKSYRHLLVLKVRNPQEYMKIKTTAPHDILNKNVKKYLPSGQESQILLRLMEMSKKVFENHAVNDVRIDLKENPANMIWLWGQGTKPQLPTFKEIRNLSGAMISAVDLVNGIARIAGLEIIDVPGATGYYDTDYAAKAEYALNTLKNHDYVYIHIEAPDEAGHNGDARAKLEAIEKIDQEIVGRVLNHFDKHDDVRILVLPDHPTPVSLRTHTSDPVGFVMYGKGISSDGSEEYTERATNKKEVKFKSGEDLINYFLKG